MPKEVQTLLGNLQNSKNKSIKPERQEQMKVGDLKLEESGDPLSPTLSCMVSFPSKDPRHAISKIQDIGLDTSNLYLSILGTQDKRGFKFFGKKKFGSIEVHIHDVRKFLAQSLGAYHPNITVARRNEYGGIARVNQEFGTKNEEYSSKNKLELYNKSYAYTICNECKFVKYSHRNEECSNTRSCYTHGQNRGL